MFFKKKKHNGCIKGTDIKLKRFLFFTFKHFKGVYVLTIGAHFMSFKNCNNGDLVVISSEEVSCSKVKRVAERLKSKDQ